MKATIKMELERATRLGHTVMTETFTFRKEQMAEAIEKVNNFIMERANRDSRYIRVKRFIVNLRDVKGKSVKSWAYTPSYR